MPDLQDDLAARVVLRDRFTHPLRTVAGIDVVLEDDGATARVGVAIVDAATGELIERHEVREPVRMPVDPGIPSSRALPALLSAQAVLRTVPDLVMIHGHGMDTPGLGLAAHLGVACDLPTIGIATHMPVGHFGALHEMRGAFAPVRNGDGRQIGWLLRSQVGHAPLSVSPGHRVSMAAAPELVMRWVVQGRLPEPLRLATLAMDQATR